MSDATGVFAGVFNGDNAEVLDRVAWIGRGTPTQELLAAAE